LLNSDRGFSDTAGRANQIQIYITGRITVANPLEAAAAENDLPMSVLVVLDLTRARAGPSCVRQFADWGTNCIKFEASGVSIISRVRNLQSNS